MTEKEWSRYDKLNNLEKKLEKINNPKPTPFLIFLLIVIIIALLKILN